MRRLQLRLLPLAMLQIGRLAQDIVWQLILVPCATGLQHQGDDSTCTTFAQLLHRIFGCSVPGLLSMMTRSVRGQAQHLNWQDQDRGPGTPELDAGM